MSIRFFCQPLTQCALLQAFQELHADQKLTKVSVTAKIREIKAGWASSGMLQPQVQEAHAPQCQLCLSSWPEALTAHTSSTCGPVSEPNGSNTASSAGTGPSSGKAVPLPSSQLRQAAARIQQATPSITRFLKVLTYHRGRGLLTNIVQCRVQASCPPCGVGGLLLQAQAGSCSSSSTVPPSIRCSLQLHRCCTAAQHLDGKPQAQSAAQDVSQTNAMHSAAQQASAQPPATEAGCGAGHPQSPSAAEPSGQLPMQDPERGYEPAGPSQPPAEPAEAAAEKV